MVQSSFRNLIVLGSSPVAVTYTSDITSDLSKELHYIQANIDSGFSLKCVRDMKITYSHMNRTDKYSQTSSIVWAVSPNG